MAVFAPAVATLASVGLAASLATAFACVLWALRASS